MGRSKKPDPQKLERLSSTLKGAEESLEKLRTRTRTLPKVKKDGSSECPFAEDLYAQKEEAAKAAQRRLEELRELLRLIENKIARCRANMTRVSRDKGSLNSKEARSQYQRAKEAQEFHYRKAVDQKKAVLELIKQIEQAAREADQKKYPGKEPRRRKHHYPPLGYGGVETSPPPVQPYTGSRFQPRSNPTGSGLAPLLSLGPLGRR